MHDRQCSSSGRRRVKANLRRIVRRRRHGACPAARVLMHAICDTCCSRPGGMSVQGRLRSGEHQASVGSWRAAEPELERACMSARRCPRPPAASRARARTLQLQPCGRRCSTCAMGRTCESGSAASVHPTASEHRRRSLEVDLDLLSFHPGRPVARGGASDPGAPAAGGRARTAAAAACHSCACGVRGVTPRA